jgi:hypothetical protein
MTIKISQLGNLTAVLGNVIIPVVANVAGTLTTVKGNVAQLKTFITTEVTADIANLQANAGAQAGTLTTLTANAAVQSGLIADVVANAAVQSGLIADVVANAAVQAGTLATLTANAAVQAGEIATIYANLGAVSGNLASQSAAIAAVAANVSATSYGDSNVASYTGSLIPSTVTANIVTANAVSTKSLTISSEYTLPTTDGNVGYVLTTDGSGVVTWEDPFSQTEFDNLIINYIPNYTGNANSFVNTPDRLEARQWVVAPNVFAANLTSIDSFYTGNVRFFDNSLQTSAYTASFANITIASSTATGTKGNICYDASYIYMCVAANTWIRSARVAW